MQHLCTYGQYAGDNATITLSGNKVTVHNDSMMLLLSMTFILPEKAKQQYDQLVGRSTTKEELPSRSILFTAPKEPEHAS